MRLVFMGTPDFAETSLRALIENGFEIAAVVTQPDRAKGRGRQVAVPPVKALALEHNIPVFQPERVSDGQVVSALRALQADVFVVAAFGRILPREVLEIAPLGCINIHASLLPRHRGASPIQQAIRDGDTVTGITVMQMDAGMDTGDILYREEIPVGEEDTGGTLFEKLAALGASCIVKTLPLLKEGKLTPEKQDERNATHAPLITKDSGRIDWTLDAPAIGRLVRAFDPWPSAYTTLNGSVLKITEACALPESAAGDGVEPGCVLSATPRGILIRTGEGDLLVTALQPAGKKRMKAADYLNGHPLESGTMLGGA